MGVVRVDDTILERIRKIIKNPNNRYKYRSIASFINMVLYDKLKQQEVNKDAS